MSFVQRMAILTSLVDYTGELGRNRLMRLVYLLQTLGQVPLGYRFQLCFRGVYAPQVLGDVSAAESWEALQEGYHEQGKSVGVYKIVLGNKAQNLLNSEREVVLRYDSDIRWVADEFRDYSDLEMEIIVLIVWIDREFVRQQREATLSDVVATAHNLRPHYDIRLIRELAKRMYQKSLLCAKNQESIVST